MKFDALTLILCRYLIALSRRSGLYWPRVTGMCCRPMESRIGGMGAQSRGIDRQPIGTQGLIMDHLRV